MDLLVLAKNMYVLFIYIGIVVSNVEATHYRLMMIGGNGYIVATWSVMQLGILPDGGEILSVLLPYLGMKGRLQ